MKNNKESIYELENRIRKAKIHMLVEHKLYGKLLMHIKTVFSDKHDTAWSNYMDIIYINPEFLSRISEEELIYVLEHLLLHIILAQFEEHDKEDEAHYKAEDIVINATLLKNNWLEKRSISLKDYGGEQKHKTPGGVEGWMRTVDEVYEEIRESNESSDTGGKDSQEPWDHHGQKDVNNKQEFRIKWSKWIKEAMSSCNEVAMGAGIIPKKLLRAIDEESDVRNDWRILLNEFIQEEVYDYSFNPPDRRYDDSEFFLPEFNEKDTIVKKILFMIDTSGSMSDEEVSKCYSEVKGAIDQFDGKLAGWLGFFDREIVEPKEFVDEIEFKRIRPWGCGGTSFDIIFEYVEEKMMDDPPVSIVILTDGDAQFPGIEEAMGIPVLWVIDNDRVTPPWGKVARIL